MMSGRAPSRERDIACPITEGVNGIEHRTGRSTRSYPRSGGGESIWIEVPTTLLTETFDTQYVRLVVHEFELGRQCESRLLPAHRIVQSCCRNSRQRCIESTWPLRMPRRRYVSIKFRGREHGDWDFHKVTLEGGMLGE